MLWHNKLECLKRSLLSARSNFAAKADCTYKVVLHLGRLPPWSQGLDKASLEIFAEVNRPL